MTTVLCAGGVVLDDARRLLLIRRGRPPALGAWSVPGGKCRAGESAGAACVREVAEETGLTVRVTRHAGRVTRPAPHGDVFVIDDFVCTVSGGLLRAGDDASDVRWVDRAQLLELDVVPELVETLRGWGLLPD